MYNEGKKCVLDVVAGGGAGSTCLLVLEWPPQLPVQDGITHIPAAMLLVMLVTWSP